MEASAPVIIDRYAVFGAIARGGMASVHLGRLVGSAGFVRTVAIKRLHAQYAAEQEFVAMFVDEARLAARITHPNVVQTLDVVHTDDELFIVMELIRGESVSRLCRHLSKRGEAVPVRYALPIMAGVLHGLHAAHTATNEHGEPLNIVHRDVSPQNILVGTDGIARVFDFGIAKARGRLHTTQDGSVKGKLAYMAREQLSGDPVGPYTDVYAAGVVLWELLVGRRMFPSDYDAELYGKVMQGCVTPPSAHRPAIPSELDRIVMKALDVDYHKRYPTAREMASALEDLGGFSLAAELGGWVEEQAQVALAERSRILAQIESQEDSLSNRLRDSRGGMTPSRLSLPGVDMPGVDMAGVGGEPDDDAQEPTKTAPNVSVSSSPEPRRRSWLAVALLLGVVVSVVVLFGLRGSPESASDDPVNAVPSLDGSTVEEPAATPPPEVTASASVTPVPSATATPSARPPAAPPQPQVRPTPRPTPRPSPPRPPPPPAPSKDACDPPHYYDSDGIKHLKPECL